MRRIRFMDGGEAVCFSNGTVVAFPLDTRMEVFNSILEFKDRHGYSARAGSLPGVHEWAWVDGAECPACEGSGHGACPGDACDHCGGAGEIFPADCCGCICPVCADGIHAGGNHTAECSDFVTKDLFA